MNTFLLLMTLILPSNEVLMGYKTFYSLEDCLRAEEVFITTAASQELIAFASCKEGEHNEDA